MQPAKRIPWRPSSFPLGVQFDLRRCRFGEIRVTNKEARTEKLRTTAARWEAGEEVCSAEAASVQGQCQFADGQLFARVASVWLPLLKRKANGVGGAAVGSEALGKELRTFANHLHNAPARMVIAGDHRPPGRILTDAELDTTANTAGVGGILLGDDGKPAEYFAEPVPQWLLSQMQGAAQSVHVISALE